MRWTSSIRLDYQIERQFWLAENLRRMDRSLVMIKATFQHTTMGLVPVFPEDSACRPQNSNHIRNTPFIMLR